VRLIDGSSPDGQEKVRFDIPFSVTNSNITLAFAGPATSHFGPQAIHGVVREAATDSHRKDR
jgi:hypothetical protein